MQGLEEIKEKKRKYKILELLDHLPVNIKPLKVEELISRLCISHKRLYQIYNIEDSTKSDLTGTQLKVISETLNVKLEEIYTEPPVLTRVRGGRNRLAMMAAN